MGPDVMLIRRKTTILSAPLKKAARLQFNCMSVSKEFIVLGSNAGSIYIFDNNSLELLKFIGNKVTPLSHIQFSPDEKALAIADINGAVTCFEVENEHSLFKPVREFHEHKGARVTAVCWDSNSAQLFVGDSKGKVTANIIFPFKLSAGQFLSRATTETILKEEKGIVQLNFCNERLLVSTYARTLLCMTDRSQFLKIGSKPRDGVYGSCFLRLQNGENTVIYCARPGSRLWEVDSTGQVMATHQFKRALAKPPVAIVGLSKDLPLSASTWTLPHAVNFPKLLTIKDRYLVTWSQYGIYIIDPSVGKIADWYDQVKDISDLICHDDAIFVLHSNGRVTELMLTGLKDCLTELNNLDLIEDFCKVAVKHHAAILNDPENYIAFDLQEMSTRASERLGPESALTKEFQNLTADLEEKHNAIRAAILERMNRVPDVGGTPGDSGVEDNDDNRSLGNVSENSSSRRSLSRLAEIDLDNMMQKAKSALVSRIVNSGFIQRALKDALEAEERRIGKENELMTSDAHAQSIATADVIVQPSLVELDASTADLSGKSSRPAARRRRRRKPKTVEFGPVKDGVVPHQLARRSSSLTILDSGSPKDVAQRVHSSPPSPAQMQATASSHHRPVNNDFASANSSPPENELLEPISRPEGGSGRTSPGSPLNLYGNSRPPNMLFQPNVDALNLITGLVDVTASSRNKLRDTRILFNPIAVRTILQDWITKFDYAVQKYVESCIASSSLSKDFDHLPETNQEAFRMYVREDFFRRLGVAFSEISNLVLLCFESGVFPSSFAKLSVLETKLIERNLTVEDSRYIVAKMAEIFTWGAHGKERSNAATVGLNLEAEESPQHELREGITRDEKGDLPGLPSDCKNDKRDGRQRASQPSYGDRKQEIQSEVDNNPSSPLKRERHVCLCRNGDLDTCDACKEDISYACFVLRFFPLLDASRIRKVLNWSFSCRWRTWMAYFVRNEDSADSEELLSAIRKEDWAKVARILLELSNPDLFMAVVEELFDAQPELVKDCMRSGLMHSWEIHFVSLLVLEGFSYDPDLISFLHKQSKETAHRDQQILIPLIKYTLEVAKVKGHLTCDCGKAKVGSHKADFKCRNDLLKLVPEVITKYRSSPIFLQRLGTLCKDGGYWHGSVELFAAAGKKQEVLDICWQLGDTAVLDRVMEEGLIKLSQEDWKSLLETEFKRDLATGTLAGSHVCASIGEEKGSEWTVNNLLWSMLRCQGAQRSLAVLQAIPDLRTNSVDAFYFACLRMKVLEDKKRKTVAKLRELVCSEARFRGQNVMSPELEAAKNGELREALTSKAGATTDQATLSLTNAYGGLDDSDWGVGVTLFGSTCQVCTLPLTSQAGFSSAGIIVFKCGHCFHRKCVPEESCISCFLKSFKTIDPKKRSENFRAFHVTSSNV